MRELNQYAETRALYGLPLRANAHLAIAGPDLLAACQMFVGHYPGGINPNLDEAYRNARAAIAKATANE